MTARRFTVLTALALSLLVAVGGFYLLNGAARRVEELLVMAFLRPMGGRAGLVNGHMFQLLPPDQLAFRAVLTPYCSALIPVLALAVIGFFILSGSVVRRLVSVLTATALILVCNVLRISASLWMGYEFGGTALVLFHDWVGTFFALAYTMAGFFLMLYLILPSPSAKIPRAARVSDVL
ncbi:MAG: exosortase/archaeosortase family protein [Sporichthyaceae bacterium]